ncbi:MAG: D-alanine--D-alanine ligase [Oscillospiraceae bacterium]|nr:D-alanine--D-alanine ligase [Oscillospiraceae bacterium]
MKKMAVFFGGRTVEHEVSVVTGIQFIENARGYETIPVYITREGEWYTGEKLLDTMFIKNFNPNDKSISRVYMQPAEGKGRLCIVKRGLIGTTTETVDIDVAVPAMHGMNGEDGSIQGLFELMNIPYTSSAMLGCSMSMDKIAMKQNFEAGGFPTLPYIWMMRSKWEKDREACIEKAETLGYPVFVKPANLGSSIGVSKAIDRKALTDAIDLAAHYDRRILIEKGLEDAIEINCSALGYEDDVRSSLCEQPISAKELLSFSDKYLGGSGAKGKISSGGKSGMASLSRLLPAPISKELTERIQAMTAEIFKSFDSKGVVRIDYLTKKDESVLYVNEINMIPGSFAFYLWDKEPINMPYSKLIDKLVEYAEKANKDKNANNYGFDSGKLLENMAKSPKHGGAKK